MTRNSQSKRATREHASAHGLTYQQALQSLSTAGSPERASQVDFGWPVSPPGVSDSGASALIPALEVGNQVRLTVASTGKLGRRKWDVQGVDERFVVLTQQAPFEKKGVLWYTILDRKKEIQAPMATLGNGFYIHPDTARRDAAIMLRALAVDDGRAPRDGSVGEFAEAGVKPNPDIHWAERGLGLSRRHSAKLSEVGKV